MHKIICIRRITSEYESVEYDLSKKICANLSIVNFGKKYYQNDGKTLVKRTIINKDQKLFVSHNSEIVSGLFNESNRLLHRTNIVGSSYFDCNKNFVTGTKSTVKNSDDLHRRRHSNKFGYGFHHSKQHTFPNKLTHGHRHVFSHTSKESSFHFKNNQKKDLRNSDKSMTIITDFTQSIASRYTLKVSSNFHSARRSHSMCEISPVSREFMVDCFSKADKNEVQPFDDEFFANWIENNHKEIDIERGYEKLININDSQKDCLNKKVNLSENTDLNDAVSNEVVDCNNEINDSISLKDHEVSHPVNKDNLLTNSKAINEEHVKSIRNSVSNNCSVVSGVEEVDFKSIIRGASKITYDSIPPNSPLITFLENGRFYRNFDDITLIGQGGFGTVYRARHKLEPGKPIYAIKLITLFLRESENLSSRRYFVEVSANRDTFSKHVVRYYTWWCEEPRFLPHDHNQRSTYSMKNELRNPRVVNRSSLVCDVDESRCSMSKKKIKNEFINRLKMRKIEINFERNQTGKNFNRGFYSSKKSFSKIQRDREDSVKSDSNVATPNSKVFVRKNSCPTDYIGSCRLDDGSIDYENDQDNLRIQGISSHAVTFQEFHSHGCQNNYSPRINNTINNNETTVFKNFKKDSNTLNKYLDFSSTDDSINLNFLPSNNKEIILSRKTKTNEMLCDRSSHDDSFDAVGIGYISEDAESMIVFQNIANPGTQASVGDTHEQKYDDRSKGNILNSNNINKGNLLIKSKSDSNLVSDNMNTTLSRIRSINNAEHFRINALNYFWNVHYNFKRQRYKGLLLTSRLLNCNYRDITKCTILSFRSNSHITKKKIKIRYSTKSWRKIQEKFQFNSAGSLTEIIKSFTFLNGRIRQLKISSQASNGKKNRMLNISNNFDLYGLRKLSENQKNRNYKNINCINQKPSNKTREPLYPVVLLIQMEMCRGLTLRDWLDSPQRSISVSDHLEQLKDPRICNEWNFFKQLIKGIKDIHEKGIVHRDLKPENIFITLETGFLKIGDFGLARFIEAKTTHDNKVYAAPEAINHFQIFDGISTNKMKHKKEGDSSLIHMRRSTSVGTSQISVLGQMIGTPGYAAPEGGAKCTEKADIYSAALILLELLCPRFTTYMERVVTIEQFRSSLQVPDFIKKNYFPWYELVRKMASHNPSERPSACEIYREVKFLITYYMHSSA